MRPNAVMRMGPLPFSVALYSKGRNDMKIELNADQLGLLLAGLNALSEGAEAEKRCCNDPELEETDDAVIQSTEVLYEYLSSFSAQARREQLAACRDLMDKAINAHYDGQRMDSAAAIDEVLGQFNESLVARILADTIAYIPGDGRYSQENRDWAWRLSFCPVARTVTLLSHPGLVNLFANALRNKTR